MRFSFAPQARYRIVRIIVVCLLLLAAASQRRSDAQAKSSEGNPSSKYSFRISLPPTAQQSDRLSLPDLPLYDRDNFYLKVRDSSQDWYQTSQLEQDGQISPQISSGEPQSEGSTYNLLDNAKLILPQLNTAGEVFLNESLVPIPAAR